MPRLWISKKAFDSVNHDDKLLEVVYNEGVKGTFFSALKSMYSSLVSCERITNECSGFLQCPVGVRQGCVMSLTLFSLFINQLADHVNETGVHGVQLLPTILHLFILLFADDIVLLSTTSGGLQAPLNLLTEYCDNLSVNKEQKETMGFRKRGYLSRPEKWFYEGNQIEVVNSYCYLGFTFSTMLSAKLDIRHLATKRQKSSLSFM